MDLLIILMLWISSFYILKTIIEHYMYKFYKNQLRLKKIQYFCKKRMCVKNLLK